MKNKFFNYSGTKLNYTEKINHIINHTSKKIYCEPFVGSGAVLFNLEKRFEQYVVADIDRNICHIYESFKSMPYSVYDDQISFVFSKFGDIENVKESYYTFRDWFNEKHWNTGSIEEGVYLHMLTNSCINSFLRFGPSGMNQSFGNRFSRLDKLQFSKIKRVLTDTIIKNVSYEDLLTLDAMFFLDPPYFSQDSSYVGFSADNLTDFCDNICTLDEFVYADILNAINQRLCCSKEFVREMVSTSPNSTGKMSGNMEYIFTNVNVPVVDLSEFF